MTNRLDKFISHFVDIDQEVLLDQRRRWSKTRPLAGTRVLDATPVFTNTLTKHAVLLDAGAELVVGLHPELPADQRVVDQLVDNRIEVVNSLAGDAISEIDVVLDCAGSFAHVPSTYGYTELTRSGVDKYQGIYAPVVLLDSSPIKLLETMYGTGDGFVRGLFHLGLKPPADASVVIFGGGKVGLGIALTLSDQGAQPIIIDDPSAVLLEGIPVVDIRDAHSIKQVLTQAWCVVTATGQVAAAEPWSDTLVDSNALLANMGVEDEFGSGVPTSRVLANKVALNFILDEPTQLRFIAPIFAASNIAAIELVSGRAPKGAHPPSHEVDTALTQSLRKVGNLNRELDMIDKLLNDKDQIL